MSNARARLTDRLAQFSENPGGHWIWKPSDIEAVSRLLSTHPAREDGPAGQWQDGAVEALVKAMERLASSEAFDMPRAIDGPLAEELRQRLDYARAALAKFAAPTKEPA